MLLTLAALLVLARLLGELILSALNLKELSRHEHTPPPSVLAVMDAAAHKRSAAYTRARLRFGMFSETTDSLLLVAILFSGLLPLLYAPFACLSAEGTWNQSLFLVVAMLLLAIPGLPLEWWQQFRIEQKHGFNNSSQGLWISDKIKGALLGLLLGFPLLWALLALAKAIGPLWWVAGFALLMTFQLAMLVLYPKLILPLFNKLSPLPEGELRDRLLALSERTGFKAQSIEVMDGSKRSGHSNAYFTGFGRFRRIVLFDTLIQQLDIAELEAVLAHEIGHYRCGHIPRMILLSAAMMLGAFAAIAWLSDAPWFNPAFGFEAGALAPSLLLFSLLSGSAGFWLSPLANLLSRKHEYEADAFAREAVGGPAPLVSALRKLARKNLTNLTPHPLYSGFHYSHPTLVERERALLAGTTSESLQ